MVFGANDAIELAELVAEDVSVKAGCGDSCRVAGGALAGGRASVSGVEPAGPAPPRAPPTLGRRLGTVGQVAEGGKPKSRNERPFTTAAGRNKNGRDEANGFIDRREPLAYHPKMGR